MNFKDAKELNIDTNVRVSLHCLKLPFLSLKLPFLRFEIMDIRVGVVSNRIFWLKILCFKFGFSFVSFRPNF